MTQAAEKLNAAKLYLTQRNLSPATARVKTSTPTGNVIYPPFPFRKRAYAAAKSNRLTVNWSTLSASADQTLFGALDALRARSRELAENNDYMSRFLHMVETNVVGPKGFRLQSRAADAGKPTDRIDASIIEAGFAKWAKVGNCELSGKLSFVDVCRLIIRTIAQDGEALIRRVRGKSVNEWGYALQLLDIDRMETRLNKITDDGNTVRMGVELNDAGRPVAYWLRTTHPGDSLTVAINGKAVRVERVLADDVFHLYKSTRMEQRRGVPWAHSCMIRLNGLGGFEEAAIVNARAGAQKMGFFEASDGDPAPLADGEEDDGEFFQESEAGTFGILPRGYKFTAYDPKYPDMGFGPFVKAALQGASAGFNVSYHGLSGDLEGVNFSSIRAGTLEEREAWMMAQNWFAGVFLGFIFEDWLKMSLLMRALKNGAGQPLPAAKLDKFAKHDWHGRRWAWVDPARDQAANSEAIDKGLKSRRQVAADQGRDLDDVFAELLAEQNEIERLGLRLGSTASPAGVPADAFTKMVAKITALGGGAEQEDPATEDTAEAAADDYAE